MLDPHESHKLESSQPGTGKSREGMQKLNSSVFSSSPSSIDLKRQSNPQTFQRILVIDANFTAFARITRREYSVTSRIGCGYGSPARVFITFGQKRDRAGPT